MVRLNHADIPALPPAAGAYDVVKDAIRQARDAACSLRSRYPGAATVGTVPGSPAQQWKDAVWDGICGRSPTPTAAQPRRDITGGKCPVPYKVCTTMRYRFVGNSSPSSTSSCFDVMGPIHGVSVFSPPPGNERGFVLNWGNGQSTGFGLRLSYSSHVDLSYSIDSITRIDGQPDNCGTGAVVYPPSAEPPLGPGSGQKPYVPPQPGKPGSSWNIAVPLIYVNNEFNLNMDVNLDLKVDVGGVEFTFDAGGVEFNFGNNGGNGSPGSGSGEQPDLSGLEQKIEQVRQSAEESKNAAVAARDFAEQARKVGEDRANNDPDDPQNNPNKQEKEQKEEEDEKQEDAINRLLAVQVDLLQKPANRRTQNGDDAPDVVYAGWFEFRTKGVCHPREPIHFDSNYFIAPAGADGYAYTLYNGFKGRATVITAKAQPPPS